MSSSQLTFIFFRGVGSTTNQISNDGLDLTIKTHQMIGWLVVSNMAFIFHNIWDVILPIDELIFFKMVKSTNQ